MKIGMLWLDADKKRTLDEKVKRAAEYYEEKYGRIPELCLVNAKSLPQEKKIGCIVVQPANSIIPHHFWLGMSS